MSDDDDSRRLYQEAYDDGCRRCDADLQQFVTPLEAWMDELLAKPLAPNWRDQLNEYLAEQEPKGYRIEPEHRWVLEEEILLQERDRRILAASNTGNTAPSSVSLLAQSAAPVPQEKNEKKLSQEELQERELSAREQRQPGPTDSEKPFLITVVPNVSGPPESESTAGDAVYVDGVEVAGPGPDTTDSYKQKVREALKVLDPKVAAWWTANSVQGQVRSRAYWWWRRPYSKLGANDQPFIYVVEGMTAGETAQAIISEVESGWFADSIGVYYRKHRFARSGDWREFKEWQQGAAQDAARLASVMAEMYVGTVATINPAGEIVVTVSDVAENGPQWNQLLSILPFAGHLAVVGIVVQVGTRNIKIPKRVAKLFKQLSPKKRKALLAEAAAAKTDKEAAAIIERRAKQILGPEHHIATSRNWVSSIRGGPWSKRFEELFRKVGLTLDDVANRVRIPGHKGPHPEEYHEEIFDRLSESIVGKEGLEARKAFLQELDTLATECATPGTKLNRLLTN